MTSNVLCVSGLAAEAKIARRAGFAAVIGEPGEAVARANILVSFGIAGGLLPELKPGSLVVSTEVVSEGGCWRGGEGWRGRIAEFAREAGAVKGPVLGTRAVLATRADKGRARAQTGAIAVDLESAAVAAAANAAGIPFLVLRAVADSAGRELPPAALIALRADGTPDLARVLASVLCRPWQVPSLLGLARDARTALAALEAPAEALCCLLASDAACRASSRGRAQSRR